MAVYNEGPQFVFESFAIFNELLFLDHLYRRASTPPSKVFYLHQFLNDLNFKLYGSAEEPDLERSVYAGVLSGALHSAQDLDVLTMRVFSRYTADVALAPEMKVYWARNRLYYTDPLYDTNYLFAGLLAVQHLRQFEANPEAFSRRYVALLKNGFTDTPQALEKRLLGIDLEDSKHLVNAAEFTINERTATLEALYQDRSTSPRLRR